MSSNMKEVIARYSNKKTREAAKSIIYTIVENPDFTGESFTVEDIIDMMEMVADGKIKSYSMVGNTAVFWSKKSVPPQDAMDALLERQGIEPIGTEDDSDQFRNEFDETIDEKSTNF